MNDTIDLSTWSLDQLHATVLTFIEMADDATRYRNQDGADLGEVADWFIAYADECRAKEGDA